MSPADGATDSGATGTGVTGSTVTVTKPFDSIPS